MLTTDPAGKKCICMSCARLVAAVGSKPVRRRSTGTLFVAVIVLAAFGLLALSMAG